MVQLGKGRPAKTGLTAAATLNLNRGVSLCLVGSQCRMGMFQKKIFPPKVQFRLRRRP